jgi:hypothetical protein
LVDPLGRRETKTVYSIDVALAEPLRFDTTLNFEITSIGPD